LFGRSLRMSADPQLQTLLRKSAKVETCRKLTSGFVVFASKPPPDPCNVIIVSRSQLAAHLGFFKWMWTQLAVTKMAHGTISTGQEGAPKRPQDLIGHNCINLRLSTLGGLYAWEFEKSARELKVCAMRPSGLAATERFCTCGSAIRPPPIPVIRRLFGKLRFSLRKLGGVAVKNANLGADSLHRRAQYPRGRTLGRDRLFHGTGPTARETYRLPRLA
jgi:hypothetical protein